MYNILICDDERDIVSALQIYLTAEGCNCFPAYDGQQALSLLEREEIHLVLMDIMMPVMDGISVMAKIREQSNIPVILLTAKGEDTDKVLGLNLGADDYVTKPFNPVELIARVRAQLRRHRRLLGTDLRPGTAGAGCRRISGPLPGGGHPADDHRHGGKAHHTRRWAAALAGV